jgi:hypothetical protein
MGRVVQREGILMVQKKRHSLLESCVSTGIGFTIAYVTTVLVLPLFNLRPSAAEAFWITSIFTVISIIRGYYVRRLFNWLHLRGVL